MMPQQHEQTPKGNATTQMCNFFPSFPALRWFFLSKDSSVTLGSKGFVPAGGGCSPSTGMVCWVAVSTPRSHLSKKIKS